MKLALVTGGARRIGAVLSARLSRMGYAVAVHCRADTALDPALGAVFAQTGAHWRPVIADLSEHGAVNRLWVATIDAFGIAPEVIVNNASLFRADEDGREMVSMAEYFAINCAAPVELALRLGETAGGCVVNILDQRILQPSGDQFAYTLSKMALGEATRLLARTLASKVRVNAVAPGLTLPGTDYGDAQIERLHSDMPLGRLPVPNDVADAVEYLVQAQSVTGQTVFVDGGAHQRSFARDFVHMQPEAG